MTKEQLAIELKRLYSKYHVDSSRLNSLTDEAIANEAKGHLAYLEINKTTSYSKDDIDIIKTIAYYFI